MLMKLTNNRDQVILINIDQVQAVFTTDKSGTCIILAGSANAQFVKETPEEIYDLLKHEGEAL